MVVEKIIMYLLRKKHKLKENERFIFLNQKNKKDQYYFNKTRIMKVWDIGFVTPSNVSINFLLSNKCKIRKVKNNEKNR